jgi:hypothetical protein
VNFLERLATNNRILSLASALDVAGRELGRFGDWRWPWDLALDAGVGAGQTWPRYAPAAIGHYSHHDSPLAD